MDPGFFYYFAAHRNPCTLAGVTRDGWLLLAQPTAVHPTTAWG